MVVAAVTIFKLCHSYNLCTYLNVSVRVVVAAKESSNIIERIAASRKERHESTVDEMHQELTAINAVGVVINTVGLESL